MNVESLKNFGRPYSETMTEIPADLRRRMRREGARVLRRHLGLLGLLRCGFLAWREERRMRRADLDAIRARGLRNEAFVAFLVQNTALFSATARIVGIDRAKAIHREIMDRIATPLNDEILPATADFERFDDPFDAFRHWMRAFLEAEREAGLHDYRIVEDSDDALAIDMTYCAFCEVPKALGARDACDSGCYSDEVSLPGLLEPFGVRFVRTRTLARGGRHCDFRFERKAS